MKTFQRLHNIMWVVEYAGKHTIIVIALPSKY